MNRIVSLIIATLSCFSIIHGSVNFRIDNGNFVRNGQKHVIKAAELHYPRIPKPYWEDRILKCKALGMNAICLYVFWNVHEPTEGKYTFDGQNNIREFINLCQQHGMDVILRPGPYVCAEWEMGGLPWWLLQDKDIQLRDNDPRFLKRVENFQERLAKELSDLTVANGGPIIMVQVENEYGSYGVNKEYVSNIRDIIKRYYPDTALFQCDWSSNFEDNALPDLIWTMNYGTGADIAAQFKRLGELRPDSPKMCSEYWSGWFDKWGACHETRPADEMVAGIREMLENDISFSLYMTHGGTNWGHWAGANSPGYAPDVTSYDYDAPIDESGAYTPKFWQLRSLMQELDSLPLPGPPLEMPKMCIPSFKPDSVAPLWQNLHHPIISDVPGCMEELGQGYGSVLYSTMIGNGGKDLTLVCKGLHDYGLVYLNGTLVGNIDRRKGEEVLYLGNVGDHSRLDILVEAMGRINFGRAIKDFKGLTGDCYMIGDEGEKHLNLWETYLLPDDYESYTSWKQDTLDTDNFPPGVYKGSFFTGAQNDTYLDMRNWGKGFVYVNGHNLGRYWHIGPQQGLYLPGCWLKDGENEVLVFDILGPSSLEIWGTDTPTVDLLQPDRLSKDKLESTSKPALETQQCVAHGSFSNDNTWQTVILPKGTYGKYLCLEISSTYDDMLPTIAELQLYDKNDFLIPPANWKVAYIDSEEKQGNHSADKSIDIQESTYWTPDSSWVSDSPILFVIDLGEKTDIKKLQYLPKMGKTSQGVIQDYNVYVTDNI